MEINVRIILWGRIYCHKEYRSTTPKSWWERLSKCAGAENECPKEAVYSVGTSLDQILTFDFPKEGSTISPGRYCAWKVINSNKHYVYVDILRKTVRTIFQIVVK